MSEETSTPATQPATPQDPATESAGSLLHTSPQTEAPSAEEKPEWLPDKYWRNGKADYESLAKGFNGLEQLLGKKAQAVTIPNEKSTPEEVAAFRKALGIPEKPDEYLGAIKPEQLPPGVEFDDKLAATAAQIAHKHNIPPGAMKELTALQLGHVQAMMQAQEAMAFQRIDAAREELKTAYGPKYAEKIELAGRVAKSAGIDTSDPMWTSPNAIRLALWAADKLSEDKIVNAEAVLSATGKGAAKDIQTNPQNPHYQRYKDGDPEVVDMVRRLIKQG